jgi:hypothetical protein
MSENKATAAAADNKMPPLVPDDAPAAQKKMHPEPSHDASGGDTLAARIAADPVLVDDRAHVSAADPPKHM